MIKTKFNAKLSNFNKPPKLGKSSIFLLCPAQLALILSLLISALQANVSDSVPDSENPKQNPERAHFLSAGKLAGN